uniref:hypothetical protein n=1 Tax=Gemmiger formicilis TaxID=745368 RepID=UPI004026F090
MKKEFVMSLSQSYRQDLLDAIQLAEQGMLSPSQQAYCFEEIEDTKGTAFYPANGDELFCQLRTALDEKRKFPSASARKPSCTSWGWNSYSMSIHPSILSGTVGACEAQYGHSLSCGYPPRLEIRSENGPDRCE